MQAEPIHTSTIGFKPQAFQMLPDQAAVVDSGSSFPKWVMNGALRASDQAEHAVFVLYRPEA